MMGLNGQGGGPNMIPPQGMQQAMQGLQQPGMQNGNVLQGGMPPGMANFPSQGQGTPPFMGQMPPRQAQGGPLGGPMGPPMIDPTSAGGFFGRMNPRVNGFGGQGR